MDAEKGQREEDGWRKVSEHSGRVACSDLPDVRIRSRNKRNLFVVPVCRTEELAASGEE
jgi:hypothetical protein